MGQVLSAMSGEPKEKLAKEAGSTLELLYELCVNVMEAHIGKIVQEMYGVDDANNKKIKYISKLKQEQQIFLSVTKDSKSLAQGLNKIIHNLFDGDIVGGIENGLMCAIQTVLGGNTHVSIGKKVSSGFYYLYYNSGIVRFDYFLFRYVSNTSDGYKNKDRIGAECYWFQKTLVDAANSNQQFLMHEITNSMTKIGANKIFQEIKNAVACAANLTTGISVLNKISAMQEKEDDNSVKIVVAWLKDVVDMKSAVIEAETYYEGKKNKILEEYEIMEETVNHNINHHKQQQRQSFSNNNEQSLLEIN